MRERGTGAGLVLAVTLNAALSAPAIAAETIVYSYDAKGRLVKVERAVKADPKVVTQYRHDKADNRTEVKVTGSVNLPPPPT